MDSTTFHKVKTPDWDMQSVSLDLDLAPCSSGPKLVCVSRYPTRAHTSILYWTANLPGAAVQPLSVGISVSSFHACARYSKDLGCMSSRRCTAGSAASVSQRQHRASAIGRKPHRHTCTHRMHSIRLNTASIVRVPARDAWYTTFRKRLSSSGQDRLP